MSALVEQRWALWLAVTAVALAVIFATMEAGSAALIIVLSLNAMVPIALVATGEIINQRAGLVNVGIEGIVSLAALMAIYGAEMFGSGYMGVACGMLTGLIVGFGFGAGATYGHGSQVIAGFGFNILVLGLVAVLILAFWGTPGFHLLSDPDLRLPRLITPWGPVSWLIPITLVIAVAAHFMIFQTRLGAHIRAAGFNPFVTDAAGLDVYRLRVGCCATGGALAGLAGAYLSLDFLDVVTKNMSQGRGFIALACIVFSGLGIALAVQVAFLFGLVQALSLFLQNAPFAKPFAQAGGSYLLLALPYAAVLIALFVSPRTDIVSKVVGQTYRRSA
jgi:simple sugar transport system permease protein